MADTPELLALQAPTSLPTGDHVELGTDLLPLPVRPVDRLDHFPDLYDLSEGSHLRNLIEVLLGDAGAGALRKSALLEHMGTTAHGAHFYDLDGFYGALFNMHRFADESLSFDPLTDTGTGSEWQQVMAADAQYRERLYQFARSIAYAGTPIGMELAAEAILGIDCDVLESFNEADRRVSTWADMEGLGTWGHLEDFTWGELSGEDIGEIDGTALRQMFTVVPTREITEEERYALTRVLNVFKPVFAHFEIHAQGIELHEEITLKGITADSNLWEIIERVAPPATGSPYTNSPDSGHHYLPDGTEVIDGRKYFEQPLPAFSRSQGASINYNCDIFGITTYQLDLAGNVLASDIAQTLLFADGQVRLTGDLAIYDPTLLNVRALAQSGKLTILPYATRAKETISKVFQFDFRQNSVSTSGLAAASQVQAPNEQVFVGGISIGAMEQALFNQLNGGTLTGSVRARNFNSPLFWATQERYLGDTTREILEMRLNAKRPINSLSFNLAHFPQNLHVEAYIDGAWQSIYSLTVKESVPTRFSPTADNGWQTVPPSKTVTLGVDRWVRVKDAKTALVETDRLRFVLDRAVPHGIPPYEGDKGTKQRSYSLALGQVIVGYTITDIQIDTVQIPLPSPAPITGSVDALGNPVQFFVHREPAEGLLHGEQWRSEPQPIRDAVVNLYVDTRDEFGNAQMIDRFSFEPTHAGPVFHIYYSDQFPESVLGDFPGVATPLQPQDVLVQGNVIQVHEGLDLGSDPAQLSIDNGSIFFDPNQPWWLGMEFINARPSNDPDERVVLDLFGNLQIKVGNGFVTVHRILPEEIPDEIDQLQIPVDLPAGARYKVTLQHSFGTVDGMPYLSFQFDSIFHSGGNQNIVEGRSFLQHNSKISFGDPDLPNDTILTNFVLKQQDLNTEQPNFESVGTFLVDPNRFVTELFYMPAVMYGSTAPLGSTDGAVLRYAPEFRNDTYPTGFVGGPPNFMEQIPWKPIPREYSLQRGMAHIPPTRAKFFKFEFSGLVPEPYEVTQAIQRVVKTFPAHARMTDQGSTDESRDALVSARRKPGTQTSIDLGEALRYTDAPTTLRLTPPDPQAYLKSQTLVARDPEVAAKLRTQSWVFSFADWHPGSTAPFFDKEQVHQYESHAISHTSKVAFFVGLRELKAWRVRFEADDNTRVYSDNLWDFTHIVPGFTWDFNNGDLFTPSDLGVDDV